MPDPELVVRRVSDVSYVATLGDVEVGWASLAVSDGVWEIDRTVTAPAYEGQGIASRLTRFVLDAADEADVTVIPSCWYVDGLMARSSPRYDHLRAGRRAPAAGEGDSCLIAPAVLPRSNDAR
jgi:predicted GNAT family acetyltransferase